MNASLSFEHPAYYSVIPVETHAVSVRDRLVSEASPPQQQEKLELRAFFKGIEKLEKGAGNLWNSRARPFFERLRAAAARALNNPPGRVIERYILKPLDRVIVEPVRHHVALLEIIPISLEVGTALGLGAVFPHAGILGFLGEGGKAALLIRAALHIPEGMTIEYAQNHKFYNDLFEKFARRTGLSADKRFEQFAQGAVDLWRNLKYRNYTRSAMPPPKIIAPVVG